MTVEQKIADMQQASVEQTQASQALADEVAGKMGEIDSKVSQSQSDFESWKEQFVETINSTVVYKQGAVKTYRFTARVDEGGYTSEGGPDSAFPTCLVPKSPWYINLLEFVANGGFGVGGDMFKVEFKMTHRGMGATDSYADFLVFEGMSSVDSVAGRLEVKAIGKDGALNIFISQPDAEDRLVPLTKELVGSSFPISFRDIGKGNDSGIARISMEIDSRYYCGAPRDFSVDVTYTSTRGQPPVNKLTQTKPAWDA